MDHASHGFNEALFVPALRPRIAQMLLIKQLIRAGDLSRDQATMAIREGRGRGPSLPRELIARGWVSPQRMTEALAELRDMMISLG